ncbi:hypothetical protein CR513_60188, partial [Mucuna pruriens]
MDSVEIVKDFPKVFPNEVLGLPLQCEVEFLINLIPRAGLVLATPYKMILVELIELKQQVEGVSPLGAPMLLVKKKDAGSRLRMDYR